MAENIKKLTSYKENELKELKDLLALNKAKLIKIQNALKAKRADLVAQDELKKLAEIEATTPIEEVKVEEVVEFKVESKEEEVIVSEPIKETAEIEEQVVEIAPVEEVKEEIAEPTKEEVVVKEEPKIELGVDGKQRRVYTPPEPVKKVEPVKKEKYKEKNFVSQGGYKQQRPNLPQNGNGQQRPNPMGGGQRPQGPRTSNTGMEPPTQFPPKKDTKGKQPVKPGNTNGAKFDDSKKQNKRTLLNKGFIVEDRDFDDDGEEIVRTYKQGKQKDHVSVQRIEITNAIITTDPVSIKTLSEKIGKTAAEIIKVLFMMGTMKTINDSISFEDAALVASEFNITLEFKPDVTMEQTLSQQIEENDIEELDNLVERPPIITIMGHVDHGKTSLLDYIRKTNVTKGEAGGITQAIGAYTIKLNDKPITFIDTPGHELFTSMRARGAQVTDIVILVVAADDGIMPQTIESISHAKQANVPIIVAVNKIDKPGANPDRVLTQLTEYDLVPEDWGGSTPVVKVSAKTGENIDLLLENILLMADVLELKANPNRKARGTIIESKLDKNLGKIATILVQTGTLNVGDNVVAGTCTGKIRAMIDDKGKRVKKAGPSIPVSVTGWDEIPGAGDRLDVVDDEKFAKQLAEERRLIEEAKKNMTSSVSLADFLNMTPQGEKKHLKLIVKTDVQGSLESIKQYLGDIKNDEVSVDLIHGAVGGINESDVSLAETSNAIIIGFNVRPDTNAKVLAQQKKIEVRFYNIVYEMMDDIESAINGMLAPTFEEVSYGSAEVRNLFKISGVGTVAGCRVLEGKVQKAGQVRVIRNGKVEYTGRIASLRHEKDDVKEMAKGFECGIMLESFQDVKVGDIIESFDMEQVKNEN